MADQKKLHSTDSTKSARLLSHPVHQSKFRRFLRLLSEPETLLTVGMLAIPPVATLLSAKAAQARPPPVVQLENAAKIYRIDPKNPADQAEHSFAINLFNNHINQSTSQIKTQTPNGFFANSFQEDILKFTIVNDGQQPQAVYLFLTTDSGGSGFIGIARDPANPGKLMYQVIGVDSGAPLQLGCALQPNGNPIFVSKTNMFVVDWVNDGKVSILNITPDMLMPGVKELDPAKLHVAAYTPGGNDNGILIASSEMNCIQFVPSNPTDPKYNDGYWYIARNSPDFEKWSNHYFPDVQLTSR